jgi:hypothetical protein
VGLGRPAAYAGAVTFDDFELRAVSSGQAGTMLLRQTFDTTPGGSIPGNWSQWSDEGPFDVSAARALTPGHSLAAESVRGQASRAWRNEPAPADAVVKTAVLADSLVPARLFLRGRGLNTAAPTYYAAVVTRGLDVKLVRVVNGVPTQLGHVRSADWVSGKWVRVSLQAKSSNLQVKVQRTDTGQYLGGDGRWRSTAAPALNVNNSSITGPGQAGFAVPDAYAGTVYFDDFSVSKLTQPLSVALSGISSGATVSQAATVTATPANAAGGMLRVEFLLDNVRQATDFTGPFTWTLDPARFSTGTHTLTAVAYDRGGNSARTSLTLATKKPPLTIPRHYSHIRIAELAYSGTPLGSFEVNLLRHSVDLVVPTSGFVNNIESIAKDTPQLVYTNTSSLYQGLLTDWLTYADAHGASREGAFYHVAKATSFSGSSPSSQPVNSFWGIYAGGATPDFEDIRYQVQNSRTTVPLGSDGTAIYLGYPDRFREINFTLASGAREGWSAILEYASSVNADGEPTGWKRLTSVSNTTGGMIRSGQITFDPPSDWKTSTIGGSARLFYVRLRTVSDGIAPVVRSITGRDYVNAHGTTSGVVPAFDAQADANHDGYLNNAEYAHRRGGMNARFVYESRLFQSYGQMRPTTNPANWAFRNWAADYHVRYLNSHPVADGLFMDNSGGKARIPVGTVLEPTANYASDYGTLQGVISKAIAPRWILANTTGGAAAADSVVRNTAAYFEEFHIRPLAQHYGQFEEVAGQVTRRNWLKNPDPYAVIDSHPSGGSVTDPRTQIATLAYYYMIADPVHTFLDFYGGYEPSTSWTRHWVPAAAYNIGQPQGSWSQFATGADPANHALTYRVYQRNYGNALVLYKPLSYKSGVTGSTGSSTATTHRLNGTYRPLHADGTVGAAVTSVTLRNGEGAILIRT